MKKIILLGLALLSFNQLTLAATNTSTTSDINLGSISLTPKTSGTFTLTALASNVLYNVTCNVSTSAAADVDVYAFNASTENPQTYLDGTLVTNNVLHLKKDHYASGYTLVFNNVANPSGLYAPNLNFTDLDDTTGANVSNCVAVVQ